MKHLTPTEIFQKMYAYYGNKSGLLDNIDLDKVKFIIEKVLEIDPHCETVKKVGKDKKEKIYVEYNDYKFYTNWYKKVLIKEGHFKCPTFKREYERKEMLLKGYIG